MLRNTNSSMNRGVMYCLGLGIMIVILFALNLLLGSVSIPANDVMAILLGDQTAKESWQFIVLQSRLPQAITATFCGAALAVSGLFSVEQLSLSAACCCRQLFVTLWRDRVYLESIVVLDWVWHW